MKNLYSKGPEEDGPKKFLFIYIIFAFLMAFIIILCVLMKSPYNQEKVTNLSGKFFTNTYQTDSTTLESFLYFIDDKNSVWIEKLTRKTGADNFALISMEKFDPDYFFLPIQYSIEDNKIFINKNEPSINIFKNCNSKKTEKTGHFKKFGKEEFAVMIDRKITQFNIVNKNTIIKNVENFPKPYVHYSLEMNSSDLDFNTLFLNFCTSSS